MRIPFFVAAGLTAAALVAPAAFADHTFDKIPSHPSYSDHVAPILAEHCAACHMPGGEGTEASGFSIESYAAVMKGTQHGSVINPGDATMSNLMRMLEGQVHPSIRMPHGEGKITKDERNVIRRWINDGAPDN